MTKQISIDKIVTDLKERAKELNCIYKVEELLKDFDKDLNEVLSPLPDIILTGWQYPEDTCVLINYDDANYTSKNYSETQWFQFSNILIDDKVEGYIKVIYKKEFPELDEGPFLKEERKLVDTISNKIGQYIFHRNLKSLFSAYGNTEKSLLENTGDKKWKTIVDLLKETDRNLYILIARKMMNLLYWSGVSEAGNLLKDADDDEVNDSKDGLDDNKPLAKLKFREITDEVFRIAADHLSEDEILSRLEKWIQEDKSSYLLRKLEDQGSSLNDISDALRRYISHFPDYTELAIELDKSLRVSLTRRFLSDNLSFIGIAKKYISIQDFNEIFQTIIYTSNSHGKLGGKSSGLFLASNILKEEVPEIRAKIKLPKTWYIASDGLMDFIHYNNLEEVFEQKYKDLDIIRQEYPYIVQLFKNSSFSPDMLKNLSMMLEEFSDIPLVVRSSTLLEDGIGAAFSGKYKSLFIANQGSKQKRIEELTSAIAEVYASVFNTDPIEYRAERGLLDYNEQMGIIVQEVVGKKVGRYFMPAFAGVAFSHNEFRWSPRIKREDGLLRLVPGLGTRAVDRIGDDYPILVAPGIPGLRVNITTEEVIKYSPKKVDVINLESGYFQTIDIEELLKEYGNDFPGSEKVFSVYKDGDISKSFLVDYQEEYKNSIVTFDGLIKNTSFVKDIHTILNTLKKSLGHPIDIEFASDGDDLYLLQCRTQSSFGNTSPSPIPKDIPADQIVFTANKYISNGRIPDITHVVYVDPDAYGNISDLKTLQEVGRAVGKLNKILPKRQFILMGPGRWGSRGDIKLGVNVTYSDINNTSVLIEIAKKKGNYVPDLSFGTHFFQDLVEAFIKYIPLYPDDEKIQFNEMFLKYSNNILKELLPEFEYLSDTIKVIDVNKRTEGKILKILLNSDLDEALAYLTAPSGISEEITAINDLEEKRSDDHWKWRLIMSEKIASEIDTTRFGVIACYVFGSTKNATAGPGSDIDMLIHFRGSDEQRKELETWLQGWGKCLAEMNYLKTGYELSTLLDVHIITDKDISDKTSYAVKIGAVTDSARELKLKEVL
ncbi:MAG: PEP/pyruvate-binding domain-containing protein [Ignavibacteria bacterium]